MTFLLMYYSIWYTLRVILKITTFGCLIIWLFGYLYIVQLVV